MATLLFTSHFARSLLTHYLIWYTNWRKTLRASGTTSGLALILPMWACTCLPWGKSQGRRKICSGWVLHILKIYFSSTHFIPMWSIFISPCKYINKVQWLGEWLDPISTGEILLPKGQSVTVAGRSDQGSGEGPGGGLRGGCLTLLQASVDAKQAFISKDLSLALQWN